MKHLLILLAFGMVGCATEPGEYCRAPVETAVYSGEKATPPGPKLGSFDRSLLRKSKKMYDNSLADASWQRNANYTGAIRVYRWGANADTPIKGYAWNPDAGERWHVVRETCAGGRPESCGRGAAEAIDEFYEADEVTLTLVGASMGQPEYGPALTLN